MRHISKGKLKTLGILFITFFKIGLVTFGGGSAMFPLMQYEAVHRKKWVTDKDMLDIFAIAESTPGPVAINTATFVGFRAAGFWGAFFATVGVVLPSYLVILVVEMLLQEFHEYRVVRYALYGLHAGALGCVIRALYSLYKQCPKSLVAYILMGLSFVAVAIFKVPVIFVIIASGIIGLVTASVTARRERKHDLS